MIPLAAAGIDVVLHHSVFISVTAHFQKNRWLLVRKQRVLLNGGERTCGLDDVRLKSALSSSEIDI